MMNSEEKEYMDYLIHNRTQLTNQITQHLDRIELLQKQLSIAAKALKDIKEHTKELPLPSYTGMLCDKALEEMEGVK